jgi:integrase
MRITIAPQKRRAELLPWCTSLADAQARANVVQRWVNRLRASGQGEYVEKTVEEGATADAAKLAGLERMVTALAGAEMEKIPEPADAKKNTFRDVGERWTSGKLHQQHRDHVKSKKSAADDEYRLEILYHAIGDVPLAAFTLDHADDAMSRLDDLRRRHAGRAVKPAVLDSGGRRQYAQVIHRVLRIAAYPLRIIQTSPLPKGWLPLVTSNKAKGLLYPEEEKRTLSCTKYELHWRIFFGFLARSGFRVDEAAGLAMKDVDLDHGVITLDDNKTDDPRAPTYGPELMTALKLWRDTYPSGPPPRTARPHRTRRRLHPKHRGPTRGPRWVDPEGDHEGHVYDARPRRTAARARPAPTWEGRQRRGWRLIEGACTAVPRSGRTLDWAVGERRAN